MQSAAYECLLFPQCKASCEPTVLICSYECPNSPHPLFLVLTALAMLTAWLIGGAQRILVSQASPVRRTWHISFPPSCNLVLSGETSIKGLG